MIPFLEFQKGMNDTLVGLGYAVYDFRPVEVPFPYIVIGEDSFVSSMTKTKSHYTVISIVNVFSKYVGNKEIKGIMNDIVTHCNTSMQVAGWKITYSEIISTDILLDTQPDVTHGLISMEFEIIKL